MDERLHSLLRVQARCEQMTASMRECSLGFQDDLPELERVFLQLEAGQLDLSRDGLIKLTALARAGLFHMMQVHLDEQVRQELETHFEGKEGDFNGRKRD